MKMMWNYMLVAVVTFGAAALVALGESANAELKLAEAATMAATGGITSAGLAVAPASIHGSMADRKASSP